eukprot:TRINITY_DN21874_c0_g2_i2.p2 TRINITY_DN21874_c0_g2~~TRINITY_DN21874_c0_g2_i2.p2  ORF type:complete len:136 (+),score=34.84 TRINITY_DN21874_c0_g2_i2:213-620(+)
MSCSSLCVTHCSHTVIRALVSAPSASEPAMTTATDLINKLPSAFDAAAAADTDCTIQFNLVEPMHVLIRNRHCEVKSGVAASPDVSLTMEDDDFVALMTGELNGMAAFMTGKLKVDGDLMLAQRLTNLFEASKLG